MSETVDFLLGQIVEKIQLSPTKWDTARQRYETIAEYLESDGSLVRGLVQDNYPQGSVRIQSATSSRGEDDQHDIDFITELKRFPGDPDTTIDLLFRSLDRGPGSRYHRMCERRNRCVTVYYADMHLDVTPAVLVPGGQYRTSRIADRRLMREIIANPEGFACWVEDQLRRMPTPMMEMRKAAEPVDDRHPVEQKAIPLLGLQLNKRWRSMNYEGRPGRKPPSVVLTKLAIDIAAKLSRQRGLLDELTLQCASMMDIFSRLDRSGQLLHIVNPACAQDFLTDRWPGESAAQRLFLDDLRTYALDLAELHAEVSIDRKKRILERLFGETATERAFEELAKRARADSAGGRLRHGLGTAAVIAPSIITGTPVTCSAATPRHAFFGGRERPVP
jgi:hypothetical protein